MGRTDKRHMESKNNRSTTSDDSKNIAPKPHVLVVEDNEDMCKVISGILQVKGCTTSKARSCEEALDAIKAARPDVVSCDIRLRGKLSGLDLARAVRNDENLAQLFLIAISSFNTEQDRKQALDAGFDMFFPKPVRFADLTNAIEAYCKRPPVKEQVE